MKSPCSPSSSNHGFAVLVFLLIAAGSAAADQSYVIQNLGTLPSPFNLSSNALGINNHSQVVGYSTSRCGHHLFCGHAFLYDQGVMTDLGVLPGGNASIATAINEAGQVVGYSYTTSNTFPPSNPPRHAFLYESGVMIDLGALTSNPDISEAAAINNRGQIVGSSRVAGGATHAFLYDRGVMTDIGTLGGSYSEGHGINNRGQVVGNSAVALGETHAFLYDHGVMSDIGTLPGGHDSSAVAINDQGQVLGYASTAAGNTHVFLYNRGVMIDLGNLILPGSDASNVSGINNRGQVIGYSFIGGSAYPFVYDKGVLTELPTASGGGVAGINNRGQVVGNSGGHAALWTPVD
jgi:probable HAF family extracellular repeat protein